VEIREAFRGYHRDDVNELLERAAATLDAANEKLRQMSERLSTAQVDSGRSRETEDILHRTLLLAQRAADDAVAEAQANARQMVDEAERQARRLVADAENDARNRGETERRRIENEVLDLSARRDALNHDIDVLSRYETEYREKLVAALETDLDALRSRAAAAPDARPALTEIQLPVAGERVQPRDSGPPTREIDMRSFVDEPAAPGPYTPSPTPSPSGSMASTSNEITTHDADPVIVTGGAPMASAKSQTMMAGGSGNGSGSVSTPTATAVVTEERDVDVAGEHSAGTRRTPAPIDLLAAESNLDGEVLDDEAFFATLREAVHDDSPLGPRDDQSSL